MKKYIIITAVLLSVFINNEYGICRSWYDLDEGEHEIYGSEREEKFPVKAFFLEKEQWEGHYSFMMFWLYKYTDYPKYESTRVLPFYYGLKSKIDNRSMTVIPPLLSYFETDGTGQTSLILFPLYYSSTDTDEYDRSVFWPLIWWGKEDYSSQKSSYQTFVPLLSYHSSEENDKSGSGEYLWVNPLFVSWRDKTSETEEKEHLWWAPIIPLTFHYTDRYYGHRNFFWLMDYSWNIENGESQMDRFWLLPLYLWKRGNDGYTAVLPPVYINNRHSNGDYYRHLLPLFATWKENQGGYTWEEFATLLYSSYSVTEDKTGEETYSNFWFPIIPLYFRSSSRGQGTHTNIAWFIDWESSNEGSLKSFWLAPLVFHQTGESGYKYYIPFYCRPSGATDKEGYTFGLFHYYNWRESGSTVWSWLYYSNEEFVAKPPVKGNSGPVEKEEFYYTHFLPVYWSWKSPESTGKLILPLVYNYKDKQTDIHVNLTGYARKTYMGPFNPDVGVGLAKKDDTWYFDSDYSWLYDVVSVSSRVAIKNPFAGKQDSTVADNPVNEPVENNRGKVKDSKNELTAEEYAASETVNGTTGISGKKGMNRENSRFFWGWKVLFGWMAYERADSQRHFRLIPLTWFTWDEKADDRLYVFLPFFLSYASEETKEEYFVIAPFYASQKQDKSYTKAYVINLYWDEYKAEENYSEKTILWPFVNWYTSPDKNGFRIFPIVWHREWKEGETESSRTFAPLYYSKDVKDTGSGEYKSRRRINPLYFLGEDNSGADSSYSLLVPLIPLFYHGTESSESTTSRTTVTPLFYYNSEETKQADGTLNDTALWFPLLPVYYSRNSREYSHWNFMGILDSCSDKNYSRFFLLPLYYSTEDNGEKHKNILGIIDWWSGENGVDTSMVFPLYWWSGDDESSSLVLFPLLSYFNSGPGEKTRFTAGAYWHESPSYERQNFLYLFDHKKYISESYPSDQYSLLFTTMELDVSADIKEMRLLWGTLLSYTDYRKSDDYDIDALLWFAGVERNGDYFHNRALPLYWYSSDKNETSLLIPPALSYFSKDSNGNFDLGVLGLVYYRNENKYAGEDRRMWLLGTLYNEVKVPERKYHARGSLWGILWDYETEDETDFTKFTILKGLYKYIDDKGESEHTFFWVF